MKNNKSQLTKKCTKCLRVFPLTQENFFWAYHKVRGKSYPQPKCKTCSAELGKAYRAKNVQRLRENHRKYDYSPKGVYKKLRHSERSWEVQMTQEDFVGWYESQPKKCFYCGLTEEMLCKVSCRYNNRTHRMTIDRIDTKKHYALGNMVLSCLRCNHIKGDFFTQSEMVEIGLKFIKPKWRNYAKKTA